MKGAWVRDRFRHGLWIVAVLAGLLLLTLAAASVIPPFALAAGEETAEALIERGAWKQARVILEPRLKANPSDVKTMVLMSKVKDAFGEREQAFKLAEQAVKLDGKSAECHEQLSILSGQMAQRAGPLKQMGLARRFKKEAEAAIQLDPRRIDARFALMLFYLKAPGIVGGDKKKAPVMADEIVGIDPVEGNVAKARLTLERHDTTGAEAFYRKAVEANPASYQAHVALANYCALDGT